MTLDINISSEFQQHQIGNYINLKKTTFDSFFFCFSGSPASLIVAYVKRILTQYTISRSSLITPDLSLTTSYTLMPTILLSEFIYVCRLIYSRTSGLLAIKRTQLHKTLAETFKIEV